MVDRPWVAMFGPHTPLHTLHVFFIPLGVSHPFGCLSRTLKTCLETVLSYPSIADVGCVVNSHRRVPTCQSIPLQDDLETLLQDFSYLRSLEFRVRQACRARPPVHPSVHTCSHFVWCLVAPYRRGSLFLCFFVCCSLDVLMPCIVFIDWERSDLWRSPAVEVVLAV